MNPTIIRRLSAAVGIGFTLFATTARADCTVTIGVATEITGPMGSSAQQNAKSLQMAFRDLNDAGGVAGCKLAADIRDTQGQATVGVDVAKQLVDIAKVPVVFTGISSVGLAILTSVTAPAKVMQVAAISTSPTFTVLAQQGKTNGMFFRTSLQDSLQGVALAKVAIDHGLKKIAVIYVNNDFGVNLEKAFRGVYSALGGEITSATLYNEKQSSYQPEVTNALNSKPEALFLIGYPIDGATVARAWISQGGPQKFLLNEGLDSNDFIQAVAPKYLNDAYGTRAGVGTTESTKYFQDEFAKYANVTVQGSGVTRTYDAAVIVGLAIAHAGKSDAESIRANMREVLDPKGTEIFAGPEGFKKALALIKEGKPIRYVGVAGRLQFDEYGDVTGPFNAWQVKDGNVVIISTISTEEVDALLAKAKK